RPLNSDSSSPVSADSREIRRSGCTPRKSSSGSAFVGRLRDEDWQVLGRIAPTSAKFSRVSALNMLDLPEPVPPTSATTVWCTPSSSRRTTWLRSASPRSAISAGIRSPARVIASRRVVTCSLSSLPISVLTQTLSTHWLAIVVWLARWVDQYRDYLRRPGIPPPPPARLPRPTRRGRLGGSRRRRCPPPRGFSPPRGAGRPGRRRRRR